MEKNLSNLGLTNDLDDIKLEQLVSNEVAIKMLVHNYKKLENENEMLKQDLNRQSTIERTLSIKTTYTKIAAIVFFLSSILLSFGVNFVTSNASDVKGWVVVILGVIAEFVGLYLSFKGVDK